MTDFPTCRDLRPRVAQAAASAFSLFYFSKGMFAYMRESGFDVTAVGDNAAFLDRLGKREGCGTAFVRVKQTVSPVSDMLSILRLAFLLRRIRPDILHAHTPKGGLVALAAGTICRIPRKIFHVHGLPFLSHRGFMRFVLKAADRMSCRMADRVLCVSESVMEEAVKNGICPEGKIKVLLDGSINGVDFDSEFNPGSVPAAESAKLRQQFGIPEGAAVVGFAGRLCREKGIFELLDAWKTVKGSIPDARLLLAGPDDPRDPMGPRILAGIESNPNVVIAGMRHDMPAIYSIMDVLVLPSYREGFPTVVLEASAMAIPVVAFDVPGTRDAVEHGVTGMLVPFGDAAALARAVIAYIDNRRLAKAHGGNGRLRVIARYSRERIWDAYVNEYREMLGEK